MLRTDRDDFEAQLAQLCAGFNVPLTGERVAAYWLGMQRMDLPLFARVVEYALGEHGPEKIPTVPQLWNLKRQMRSRPKPEAPPIDVKPAFDHFHGFGQRCLLRWLRENGPVEPDVLLRLVAGKNRLVEQFREIATEEPITAEDVRPAMLREFARLAA